MSPVVARVLTWLAVLLAIAGTVWLLVSGYESWASARVAAGAKAGYSRCKAEWADANTKQAAATVQAVEKARLEERETAAAAAQGERDAREHAELQAKRQADAADRTRAAAGSLRNDLAALDAAALAAGIPDAASCPGQFARQRDDAIRARSLFGACVTEYRQLAEDVDGAASGLELKLATALSWIHAATGASGAPQ